MRGGRRPFAAIARVVAQLGVLAAAVWLSSVAVASSLPAPWLWAAGLCLVACCVELALGRYEATKVAWLGVAAAVATLGGYEAWLQIVEPEPGVYSEQYKHGGYMRKDDVFGYAPTSGVRIASSLRFGDDVTYDVVYTIGDDGLRVTPDPGRKAGAAAADDRDCLLFFGGSFTFGEGVDDDETLPAQVARVTDGRWRVRNYGFHGYGPHQMLVAFESGFVARTAGCHPTHIFLQTAIWHARRVIGATTWDPDGPRYVLDAGGNVERAGKFSDFVDPGQRRLLDLLERSLLFRHELAGRFDPQQREATEHDVDLMVAIIARSRDLAAKLYPDAAFHVLLWDMQPPEQLVHMRERLDHYGLDVHDVRAMLADGGNDPLDPSYYLRLDEHPSPKAYAVIARHVRDEVLLR